MAIGFLFSLVSRGTCRLLNSHGNVNTCRFISPAPDLLPHRPPAKRGQVLMLAAKRHEQKRNWSPRIENKIARMRYHFLETYECGIELVGTEIKSVRAGKMQLREGYARVKDGELFLLNVNISPWETSGPYFSHDADRPRKLLLHKRYIRKLEAKLKETGLTVVPTCAYFNSGGYLKIEIALAKGKQLFDRREDIKRREDAREMHRIVKSKMGEF